MLRKGQIERQTDAKPEVNTLAQPIPPDVAEGPRSLADAMWETDKLQHNDNENRHPANL
jgi:hypothetical protein